MSRLILEHDNPCNTTLIDSDTGEVIYEVSTKHGKNTVTRIDNAAGETIASWKWREIRSDVITIGSGTPVSVSTWLRKSLVPFKNTVSFQDHLGRKLIWQGDGPGQSLQLFSEDNSRDPMVYFRKSRRIVDPSSPATSSKPQLISVNAEIILDNRGMEIQDIAVISFLVLEKSRRTRENSMMNRTSPEVTAGASMGIAIGGGSF